MSFDEALIIAKSRIGLPGLKHFALFTFEEDGKYQHVHSCGPLELTLIKIHAERQTEKLLFAGEVKTE